MPSAETMRLVHVQLRPALAPSRWRSLDPTLLDGDPITLRRGDGLESLTFGGGGGLHSLTLRLGCGLQTLSLRLALRLLTFSLRPRCSLGSVSLRLKSLPLRLSAALLDFGRLAQYITHEFIDINEGMLRR